MERHSFSEHGGVRQGWVPVFMAALLCLLTIGLWWTLEQRERENLQAKVTSEARNMAADIDADLRNRIPALERKARNWEYRGGAPQEEMVMDAQAYLADVPGFQALEWVDKNYYIQMVVPVLGNEPAVGFYLGAEEKRRSALEKARYSHNPAVSAPVDLVQGGKGCLVFFPIYLQGDFGGALLAVFRMQEWLNYVVSSEKHFLSGDEFKIYVTFEDVPVYTQDGWSEVEKFGISGSAEARILDRRLIVYVRPTSEFIAKNQTHLPKAVAGFGLMLAVIVWFTIRLYQKVSVEAWWAQWAKAELENEAGERKKAEMELQQTLARLDLATKAGGIGVWAWDIKTNRLTWNEMMYQLYDIPPDVTPIYETWRNTVHPDDRNGAETLLKNAVEGKSVFNTRFRILHSTGAVRYLGAAARVERDCNGNPQRVTGINWDMTELKQVEETLKNSEEKVRLLLNSTAEAIYGIDMNGECTFANPACLRMLGYLRQEDVLGKNMHQLIHHSYEDGRLMRNEDCRIYQAFREGKLVHADDEVLWKSDGKCFPAEYWSYPQFVDGNIIGAVVTFTDITERKKAEKEIMHLATHDALTDLPTLRVAHDRIVMAMGLARRHELQMAVFFLDLDGFKQVNDTYGHNVGDYVLKHIAATLKESVRETDTVARVGGDEFLVVAGALHIREDAEKIAKEIIHVVSQPILWKDTKIQVGVSVGIAMYPADGEEVEGLIKLADEAMYRVKKAGKNGYAFTTPI